MNKLKCKAICTEGGCKVDCKIRECVNNHKFEGCWECSDFKSCQLLEPLKEFHNLEFNLEMIKNTARKNGYHIVLSITVGFKEILKSLKIHLYPLNLLKHNQLR